MGQYKTGALFTEGFPDRRYTTVIELVGIKPLRQFQGRSLLPVINGDDLPARPIYSELSIRVRGHRISILSGRYRWIYNLDKKKFVGVYRVDRDPDERENIVKRINRKIRNKKGQELAEWYMSQEKNRLPPARVSPDTKLNIWDIKALRNLGYIQ